MAFWDIIFDSVGPKKEVERLEEVLDDPSIEDRLDDIVTILLNKGTVTDEALEKMLKCQVKKP